MAHFAKLDENNKVIAVHVINNDVLNIDGNESEQAGIEFLVNLHGHLSWKQTSYNGNFRKNYAGVGYTYDQSRDAFIPEKTYSDWILNEDTCRWEAPIPMPDESGPWKWDEISSNWIR